MADEVEAPPAPETDDVEVTPQPAISTEEAAATDVELSPIGDTVVAVPDGEKTVEVPPGNIEVRSASAREIDMRIMPWGVVINSTGGTEEFARGAFSGTDPSRVYLVGPEHERHLALGHNGSPDLVRRPVGRGLSLDEREDGAYMTFKVARTSAGDDVLALIEDGITPGVSVEFGELPGGTDIQSRSGRRHRVQKRVRLDAVTTTYRPAYGEQAAVLAVRSQDEGDTHVTETLEAPAAGVEATSERVIAAIAQIEARSAAFQQVQEKFLERLDQMDEQARSHIEIPNPGPETPKFSKGEWLQTVVKLINGEQLPQAQMRALEDVITTDNPGVVPPTYLKEMIGVIDASRPFLQSTRRLEEPATMKLTVPVITQRPAAAVQAAEKTEVESRKTIITSTDFDAITIAGAGDLSIQIINKSSPSFLDLWMELLGEAYAIEAEDQAVQALFNATGGVGAGTALNPNLLNLGAAFVTSFDAIRRPPDTIWLSTAAVGEFIDAKATTTNQPLYPGLTASATAAGGITGLISGLRAVHVPTLDAHGAYAIVGPSSGFAWAESGTYTLQADNPTLAGRDIALVGLLYPAPWYPAAFSLYNVAS
jgi:phage head maturation protease